MEHLTWELITREKVYKRDSSPPLSHLLRDLETRGSEIWGFNVRGLDGEILFSVDYRNSSISYKTKDELVTKELDSVSVTDNYPYYHITFHYVLGEKEPSGVYEFGAYGKVDAYSTDGMNVEVKNA